MTMMKVLVSIGLIFSVILTEACLVLDYEHKSIIDSQYAAGLKDPKPVSVSVLIKAIKKKLSGGGDSGKDIEIILHLQQNNITEYGLIELLRYLREFRNLVEIDLSCNKISDLRRFEENDEFESLLKEILEKESFRCINFSKNYLDLGWYKYIKEKFPSLSSKIVWR